MPAPKSKTGSLTLTTPLLGAIRHHKAIAYPRTKFDNSIASAVSEIWLEFPKFKMDHVTLTTRFSGWFVILRLEVAMSKLFAKFEISISTVYEDMKGDAKCRKWGGLEVVTGHSRSLK